MKKPTNNIVKYANYDKSYKTYWLIAFHIRAVLPIYKLTILVICNNRVAIDTIVLA